MEGYKGEEVMALQETFNSYIEQAKSFWKSFDMQKWAKNIGGDSAQAVQAAIYLGCSIVIGFFFKKYFKFLFVSFTVAFIIIAVLHYNHFVTIDWNGLSRFVGLGKEVDINYLINNAFGWIKANVVLFVASVVGFLIGYKLG